MEHLKYPIGKFNPEIEIKDEHIQELITEIKNFPYQLKEVVLTLNSQQLETPYRPDGWQVRQVVHHLADSHMNAYIRFNLSLTEENPTIKPYKENLWADLSYKQLQNITDSLVLLEIIHRNWVLLLQSMTSADFNRTYTHPEYKRVYSLRSALGSYAWHGKHHLAQITALIERDFIID
ncbi:MAG: putative metal-dependent hydrolase [Bacteroidia bacterium]|nr:putative metal-dependent hydrolase [Bacteroidia bacterium]